MVLVVAWISLLVASVAVVLQRRQARQLARLTEMYWQLKYDHGELKAALTPPPVEAPPPVTAFVPLGSVKRSPS